MILAVKSTKFHGMKVKSKLLMRNKLTKKTRNKTEEKTSKQKRLNVTPFLLNTQLPKFKCSENYCTLQLSQKVSITRGLALGDLAPGTILAYSRYPWLMTSTVSDTGKRIQSILCQNVQRNIHLNWVLHCWFCFQRFYTLHLVQLQSQCHNQKQLY